jgi:uncharacterized membrane protein YczE
MEETSMLDRTLARGLFISGVALAFGLTSLQYVLGTFNRPGPGLFPVMASGALLLIGVLIIAKSFFVKRQATEFHVKNIALILLGLGTFAGVSKYLNMIAGITVMVVVVSRASDSFSWLRCVQIAAGLIAVAFAFQKLFGLNLPLV